MLRESSSFSGGVLVERPAHQPRRLARVNDPLTPLVEPEADVPVPDSVIQSLGGSMRDASVNVVVCHTDWQSRLPIELSLAPGCRVVVIDSASREGWFFGVRGRTGKAGWFPKEHVWSLDVYREKMAYRAKLLAFRNAMRLGNQFRAASQQGRRAPPGEACRQCGHASDGAQPPLCHSCRSSLPPPVDEIGESWGEHQHRPYTSGMNVKERRRRLPSRQQRDAVPGFNCPVTKRAMVYPVLTRGGWSQESSSVAPGSSVLPNHALRSV